MERHGIINNGRDTLLRQVTLQGIAAVGLDGVDVEDMVVAWSGQWQLHRQPRQAGVIPGGNVPTTVIPGGQVAEFHPKEGGLQFIEPGVESMGIMVVPLADPVDTGAAKHGGEVIVGGHDHPSVPTGTEIFCGIEAEAADAALACQRATVGAGTDGLGRVFNDRKSKPQQFRKRCRLSEQVDGENHLGSRGQAAARVGGIDGEISRIDVGKDDAGPQLMDALGRGDVGEGGGNDFIPRANAQGMEGQGEGVGTRINADAMAGTAKGGDLGFERLDLGTQNVPPALQHGSGGGKKFVAKGVKLGGRIEKGNRVHQRVEDGATIGFESIGNRTSSGLIPCRTPGGWHAQRVSSEGRRPGVVKATCVGHPGSVRANKCR